LSDSFDFASYLCIACTNTPGMKVRIGISFEKEIVDALEEQVRSSPDLALDRSEIVNVVMKAFLNTPFDHRAKTRELVRLSRNGQLKLF
jgi:metal-responsive CopG/Arc/MetJ family transcriptional regulator